METSETLTLAPMYKMRLKELCHQRMWPTPDYTVRRDGPDHNPRFSASVTVNGVSFHAPDVSKSSKEAQSKAAQVAVDHFAVALPPNPSPQPPAVTPPHKPSPQSAVLVENRIAYKAQLQIYAQKNGYELPKYDTVREGYAHALRFKSSVTVDGQTFNSPQFFNTLKEAENDAAKVALLSLSLDENSQDKSYLYKIMLQELATKEGISLPKYKTTSKGASHMLIFSSTVEIGGSSFMGDVANSKKQAEMNAAKVAWFKLKERFNGNSGNNGPSSSSSVGEHLEAASSGSRTKDTRNLELPKSLSVPQLSVKTKHSGDNSDERKEDGIIVKNGSSTVAVTTTLQDYQGPHLTGETMVSGNEHTRKMSASHNKLDAEVPKNKEVTARDTTSQDGTSRPSSLSGCSDHPVTNVISEPPVGRASSSLHCNRVRIYPHTPDMVLPKDAISLPFSDDTWVAVSLDFSNHEDIYQEAGLPIKKDSSTVSTPPPQDDQGKHSTKEIMLNGNGHIDESDLHKLDIMVMEDTSSEVEASSSLESDCNDNVTVDINSESPMRGAPCSSQCNRVTGVSFHTPELSRSSKEAQSKATQVAVDHFAVTLPPKPSPQPPAVTALPKPLPQSPVLVENRIAYKTQLQIYAQKNGYELPKYDTVREGYAHALRFKSSVTVNGQTFNSPQFFNTLKEAENDAAKVALLSLSPDENSQDKSYLYKIMLQELATKEGISLPKYKTTSNGASHMLIFSSTVEIGGSSFMGDVANSKKQAEMNAAKVAWFKLKERFNGNSGNTGPSSSSSVGEHHEAASSGSQTKDTRNLELPKSLSVPLLSVKTKHSGDNSDIYQEAGLPVEKDSITVSMPPPQDDQGKHSTKEIMLNGNGRDESDLHMVDILVLEDTSSEDEASSSLESASNDNGTVDINSESPMRGVACSLQCNRVRVYPNKPNLVLPEGASRLPFSDDKWVAISMDF